MERESFARKYSLSIVLFLLFFLSWVAQFGFQVAEFSHQAAEHGQEFSWNEFWPQFGKSTMENWQSEFLQLFTFVVLTALLMHRGSPESKDSDEKMEAALDRIEKQLGTAKASKASKKQS
jgi:lysylphosphatidylglycerol synthetase-like protein (DUF2156 family)